MLQKALIPARRDRQCWGGGYLISMPGTMVLTFDMISIRNAVDVLISRRGSPGQGGLNSSANAIMYNALQISELGLIMF